MERRARARRVAHADDAANARDAAMSEANYCGEAASLSMSHNSAQRAGDDLPFRLTGSQAKTKRAIEINVERMAREAGVERVGFLTLTVGDLDGESFVQVFDAAEANRRINALARRFLPSLFRRWVIVTERHKSGAVHFHLAVETRVDIRGAYDWEAVRAGDYASAPAQLRALWAVLRSELPSFGFGRAQLEPAKGSESLARYVAKYVEKNLFNRIAEDRGKKLVRYGGWNKTHCRSNDISWATPRAAAWRAKAAKLASFIGADRQTIAEAVGPKWSFRLTERMNLQNDHAGEGEEIRPMLCESEFPARALAIGWMREIASAKWLRHVDAANAASPVEWRIAA